MRSSKRPHRQSRIKDPFLPEAKFWDNLRSIWLSKYALLELQRRIGGPLDQTERPSKSVADILGRLSPDDLKRLKRVSRRGGLDLSDLRNYPYPPGSIQEPSLETPQSASSGAKRLSSPSAESTDMGDPSRRSVRSSAYDPNFQNHLIDNRIHPAGYEDADGRRPEPPKNKADIMKRLPQKRRSLLPSRFSDDDFLHFERENNHAATERDIMGSVLPIIEGSSSRKRRRTGTGTGHDSTGHDSTRTQMHERCDGLLFANLSQITDVPLGGPRPDRVYGADPGSLNKQVREELNGQIVPSKRKAPILPNFFLEVKGPEGNELVAKRQACYTGAFGSRGMHALQSYQPQQEEKPAAVYDENAYSITSTYHADTGTLSLYANHPREATGRPGSPPEHVMTRLGAWLMTNDAETFRQGAAAYRNARDWAKEQRDRLISQANAKVPGGGLQERATTEEVEFQKVESDE
ncbi:uncharacterized protein BJX67DRAFT_86618 [Aspergillus lucknowensis]|uniref:Uncharacterized protein n=1 Tax=Aspergillus lucknowensis TaxID=176173 RepID=A0ABR4M577_9EURO